MKQLKARRKLPKNGSFLKVLGHFENISDKGTSTDLWTDWKNSYFFQILTFTKELTETFTKKKCFQYLGCRFPLHPICRPGLSLNNKLTRRNLLIWHCSCQRLILTISSNNQQALNFNLESKNFTFFLVQFLGILYWPRIFSSFLQYFQ